MWTNANERGRRDLCPRSWRRILIALALRPQSRPFAPGREIVNAHGYLVHARREIGRQLDAALLGHPFVGLPARSKLASGRSSIVAPASVSESAPVGASAGGSKIGKALRLM
jgi:hypothetical protein